MYQFAEQGEDLFPKKYKYFSIELLQGLIEAGQEQLVQDILIKNREKHFEQYHLDPKNKTFVKKCLSSQK